MAIKDYSVHNIAFNFGKWISIKTGQPEKCATFCFGSELLFGALFKLTLIIFFSLLFNIFSIVVVIVFTAGTYRILSGGAHCSAYYRCLLSSLLVFLLLGNLLKLFLPYLQHIDENIFILPLLIGFYWTVRWAPVPPENKPFIKKKKLVCKFESTLLYMLICIAVCAISTFSWLSWSIVVGLVWQSFTLTPNGHRLINFLDKMFANFSRKGGESNYETTIQMPH